MLRICALSTPVPSLMSSMIISPLLSCSVPVQPLVPWCNQEMLEAKHLRLCLERRRRRTGLIVHQGVYRAQCSTVKSHIINVKLDYFTNQLTQCEDGQKASFRLMDGLLQRRVLTALRHPSHESLNELSSRVCDFFHAKI